MQQGALAGTAGPDDGDALANATQIQNCYDPIHSHWAIDTSATNPAGRAITYSFEVATADVASTPDHLVTYMREALVLDAAGRLSQVFSTSHCDAFGTNYFTITVIATPANGGKPLRRSFLFTVRDDG